MGEVGTVHEDAGDGLPMDVPLTLLRRQFLLPELLDLLSEVLGIDAHVERTQLWHCGLQLREYP